MSNLIFQIIEYVKFWFTSTNQHGIHSPFVYQLITRCFYDRKPKDAYAILKTVYKQYKQRKDTIVVNDLGAGSHRMNVKERKIASIAKNAGTTYTRAQLLYRMAAYFSCEKALELGTSLGFGSVALSLCKTVQLTTVEACSQTLAVANSTMQGLELKNIQLVNQSFSDYLKTLPSNTKFDLIFLDGHHDREATLHYFETLLQHVHNDTVLIIDDIYWSRNMLLAWEKIKDHSAVKVSIDTYFWGIVFFRKEQVKQHFKIRV